MAPAVDQACVIDDPIKADQHPHWAVLPASVPVPMIAKGFCRATQEAPSFPETRRRATPASQLQPTVGVANHYCQGSEIDFRRCVNRGNFELGA
jgi:hypothetical protein